MLERLALPLLHQLPPETAHDLTIAGLKSGLMTRKAKTPAVSLSVSLFGTMFPNPIGLAAGFDKNAEAIDALLGYGFGFVEVGTVTPKPQDGNPKPRLFRDKESRHVINRMGFNNKGLKAFDAHYDAFRMKGKNKNGIVGINVGKNKDQDDALEDYVALVHHFGKKSDYLTINISSPNTPGLRDLQDPSELLPFLRQLVIVRNARCKTPLLVKLAPDLDETKAKAIVACLMEAKVDGVILTNTTMERPDFLPDNLKNEAGGLSGPCLQDKSNALISLFYRETGGKLPIIGVGGVDSAESAYAKIKAGASLVQLYTAMIYHGPKLVKNITKRLPNLLAADGFKTIHDAIGVNAN
jgi:dihydroorotate dehydrogenase